MTIVLIAIAGLTTLSVLFPTPSRSQEPAATAVQVTSAALVPGLTAETFTLRLTCQAPRDYATFWAHEGHTFVLDVRDAYTPFRGSAVGELNVPGVSAVRASQFLEGAEPIARFELDTDGGLAAYARWVGSDLEVHFGPGDYNFRGTGRTRPPGSGTAAPVRPTEPETGTPVPPPSVTQPATGDTARATGPGYRTGGRDNPFDPLLKPPTGVNPTLLETRQLPDVESMTLTGIVFLEDRPAESVALLRDASGYTYRLRLREPVRFGLVTRITRTEIFFALDKYGRQYEFKLSLQRNPR